MQCLRCRANFDETAGRCPVCGRSAPEGDGATAQSVHTEEAWETRWRQQFEKRRLIVSDEELERSRELLRFVGASVRLASAMRVELTGGADEHYSTILEKTRLRNGFVARFFDDGLLAVFGAPITHDDDTADAARAALEILQAFEGSSRPSDESSRVRIGIATGRLVARTVRREERPEFVVEGDAVELASRLAANASPGQVFVCRDTADRLREAFLFEPSDLSGDESPEAVPVAFRLTSERPARRTKRPHSLPFVGRAREVSRVCDLLDKRPADEFLHVVVFGEAGVGKTRLIREIADKRRSREHFVFLNNSPHGAHVILYPLLDWLRSSLGLRARSDSRAIRSALESFAAFHPGLSDVDGRLLGYVFGLPDSTRLFRGAPPASVREMLFQAFLTAMRGEAGPRPLAVAIDDSQWADPQTKEWGRWLESLRPDNVVLFDLSRLESAADAGAPARKADLGIRLSPLNDDERRRLLEHLLPDDLCRSDVVEALEARGAGNPLLSAELARGLMDLIEQRGADDLSAQTVNELLPDSARALAHWRLDRLNRNAKLVLQCGAVLGLEFSRDMLGLIERIRDRLLEQLRLLKARAFLDERGSPDLKWLRFFNPVTRDVAYEELPPEDKRDIHKTVAEGLEENLAGEPTDQAEALAYHWEKAGDAERALHWLVKTAERRRAMGAYRPALEACDKTIALLRSWPSPSANETRRLAEMLNFSGRIRTTLGEHRKALEQLDESQRLAESVSSRAAANESVTWQGVCLMNLGEVAKARRLLETAAEEAERLDLPDNLRAALNGLGLIERLDNRLESALERFDRVERIAEKLDRKAWRADALNNAALILQKLLRYDEALDRLETGLPLRREMGDWTGLAASLMNMGALFARLGASDRARDRYEQSMRLAKKTDYRPCLASLWSCLSDLDRREGSFVEAAENASRAIVESARIEDARLESYGENNLAQANVALGRWSEAMTRARRARVLARRQSADKEAAFSALLTVFEARLGRLEEIADASAARRRRNLGRCRRAANAAVERIDGCQALAELRPRALRMKARALLAQDVADDAEEKARHLRQAREAARSSLSAAAEMKNRQEVEATRQQFTDLLDADLNR